MTVDSEILILYSKFNPILLYFLAQIVAALAAGGSLIQCLSLSQTPIIGGIWGVGFVCISTSLLPGTTR